MSVVKERYGPHSFVIASAIYSMRDGSQQRILWTQDIVNGTQVPKGSHSEIDLVPSLLDVVQRM